MLQIDSNLSGRTPGGHAPRLAALSAPDSLPCQELPLVLHRAPIPEDEPIPGDEPEPEDDPVPHPDPVIREPDGVTPPPMSVAAGRLRRIAFHHTGA